jgi:hypothetical protein
MENWITNERGFTKVFRHKEMENLRDYIVGYTRN